MKITHTVKEILDRYASEQANLSSEVLRTFMAEEISKEVRSQVATCILSLIDEEECLQE
jgi:hypothetical protein